MHFRGLGFPSNSRLASLVKDAGFAFVLRALGTASGFLMNLAVTRSLGAAEAGLYFLALAAITFLSAVSRAGLDNTILRFIAANAADKRWDIVNSVFRQSFRIVFAASTLVAILLWLLAPWASDKIFEKPEVAPVLRAIAPGLIAFSLSFLISFAFQAVKKVPSSVFSQSLGIAVGVCFLAHWMLTAVEMALLYSAVSFFILFMSYFWWKYLYPQRSQSNFSLEDLKRSAVPLWIVTITAAMQQWGGQFVAGAYVSSTELAQLAVAQRTAFLISFVLMAVNLVIAPRFAASYQQKNFADLQSVAQFSVKLILLFSTPLVLVLIAVPELVMSIFGDGFSDGANLLRILALGQLINAATGSTSYLLIMSGNERDLRNLSLVVGPASIVLAMALVPFYGVLGAATATAIAVASQNIGAAYFVRKRLGFSMLSI